jgi:outer membrane protein
VRDKALLLAAVLAVIVWSAAPLAAQGQLSLEDAITRAQQHSYSVQSVQHDSAAAKLTFESARRDRFPSLTLSAKSFYINKLQGITVGPISREIGSKENYQTDLTLSLPLYTGGRLSNGIGIRDDNRRAEALRLETERMSVAYRTRKAYLGVLSSEAQVRAAQASLDRVNIIYRNVSNLHQNGMADSLDLLEVELALESARQFVRGERTEEKNARVMLFKLLGEESDTAMNLVEDVPEPDLTAYDEIARSAEFDRPELKRLGYIISAADRSSKIELGGYLPTLSGFVGYSYGKPNKDIFGNTWNDYFTGGMTLNWTLNVAGKTSKDVGAARQKAESARMARKALLDNLQTQRDMALNTVRHAYQTVDNYRIEYDISRRQYNLAKTQQEAGRLTVNRLLELETDLTAAEQHYQSAIINYYLAETDLLYTVGSPRIFGGLR